MKFSSFSRLLITICFLWLLAAPTAAQDFGVTYGGYTYIDYDEETNIVTAYSETYPENYELAGDYEAQVNLVVTNEYGVTVASGSGQDYGDGTAHVELSFAGEPGRTYTATGIHRALSYLYSYDEDYPHLLHAVRGTDNLQPVVLRILSPDISAVAAPHENHRSRQNLRLGFCYRTE